MRITFLGTTGYIDISSPLHALQAATLISFRRTTVMLDCGEDWLDRVGELKPDGIAITHGHPDHFFGLKHGAPCPVWATHDSWETAPWRNAVEQRQVVEPGVPFHVGPITLEAFTLRHSTRAPAVGYRVSAGQRSVFYAPDVLAIDRPADALTGVDAYIGERSLVRPTKQGEPVGHAAIRVQLDWCEKAGVKRAWFTHCGVQITGADPREVDEKVGLLGQMRGMRVAIAHDGLHVGL